MESSLAKVVFLMDWWKELFFRMLNETYSMSFDGHRARTPVEHQIQWSSGKKVGQKTRSCSGIFPTVFARTVQRKLRNRIIRFDQICSPNRYVRTCWRGNQATAFSAEGTRRFECSIRYNRPQGWSESILLSFFRRIVEIRFITGWYLLENAFSVWRMALLMTGAHSLPNKLIQKPFIPTQVIPTSCDSQVAIHTTDSRSICMHRAKYRLDSNHWNISIKKFNLQLLPDSSFWDWISFWVCKFHHFHHEESFLESFLFESWVF